MNEVKSFRAFLGDLDLENAEAKKPRKTDQGHCGGNSGGGILSQVFPSTLSPFLVFVFMP